MSVPYLTRATSSQLEQLNSLLERAETLKKVRSHPGETEDFINWRTEFEDFIALNCGHKSHPWGQLAAIIFFPRWFNTDEHGPLKFPNVKPGIPTGMVLTGVQEEDRATAFEIYIKGLTQSTAIIKSLIAHVKTIGSELRPNIDSPAVGRLADTQINFSPTLTNSQSQSQSQQQSMTLEQSMTRTLEAVKEHYGEEQSKKAAEKLEELKTDRSWGKICMVVKWFLELGREAFIALLPTLAKILLPLPQD